MYGRKAPICFAFRCFVLSLLLPLSLLISSASSARAEYILPSDVVVRTKAYAPQETNFPRGKYDYQISWQGLPVGTASISISSTYRDGKKMLDVEATAKTGKMVSLFYELRHRSESIFSASELRPEVFESQQTENSRFTNTRIEFSPEGTIDAKVRKGKIKTPGETQELKFKSENHTFDPITAAFLARSLPVDTNEDLSFDVFNGKHRYLISFHVLGREKVKVAGKTYDAFKVEPSVKKLTDTEGEKRLRRAYLWVSTDPSREVLKLESEVFLGSVNAKLVRFTPDSTPDPDVARARLDEASKPK